MLLAVSPVNFSTSLIVINEPSLCGFLRISPLEYTLTQGEGQEVFLIFYNLRYFFRLYPDIFLSSSLNRSWGACIFFSCFVKISWKAVTNIDMIKETSISIRIGSPLSKSYHLPKNTIRYRMRKHMAKIIAHRNKNFSLSLIVVISVVSFAERPFQRPCNELNCQYRDHPNYKFNHIFKCHTADKIL